MTTAAAASTTDAAPPQDQPSTTTQQQENPFPNKPYNPLWNPNLPWLDLLIQWVASWFFPVRKLVKYEPQSEKAQEINGDIRTSFDKNIQIPLKSACKKWSKACDGLVQCTWKVPRRPEILYEWGIIDKDDALLKQVMEEESSTNKDDDDGFVTVHVRCPASLVLKEEEGDDRTVVENDCGCVQVDSINLKDIPQDVPVVLWFHGGGLTVGRCDFGWDEKILPLLEKQKKSSGGESAPPLLLAAVEYRLAPDDPLPAASIDALSVVDYCLKDDESEDRKIHVSGESAGGYLSLVSAFAGHKHYPGRIQSALVLIPFISPAADSMSYYMNGPSQVLVPVSWARWCWRAALQMDDDVVDDDDDDVDEEDDVLAIGSNRTAWNKSKWKKNEQWHKFLEPMAGMPEGLDDKEKGTKYIVAVNKGDILYSEGNELMHKLKEEGADVVYVEALGSHGIGFAVDRKAMAELIEAWRVAIFGD